MQSFVKSFLITLAVAGLLGGSWLSAGQFQDAGDEQGSTALSLFGADPSAIRIIPQKSPEEMRADALEKSREIKGLYMTADVANDQGAGATRLRNHIIGLATSTEINGIVIDVKEVCGADYSGKNLSKLLDELHKEDIWVIARITAFKDASQIYAHPEWYLKRGSPKLVVDQCAGRKYLRVGAPAGYPQVSGFWQDNKGGYWLDPADPNVRQYLFSFSKKMVDIGFDELQFDYIRFPSDGDVEKAVYPAWDGKTAKYAVMKSFFHELGTALRAYKPDIILSADLFGYVALRLGDVGIGQRLEDIGDHFDYVSFMVYPSHYYSGLFVQGDPHRNLPAVHFNAKQVRSYPDITVERSLQSARDFLDGTMQIPIASGTSTATTTGIATTTKELFQAAEARSRVRLRPWLEDFFHEQDRLAKRPYGAEKVRMQIQGAERVEEHGWLLWNASNVYTSDALEKE